MWFIICRAADSTQNATLCQQEAKKKSLEGVKIVREEVKIEDRPLRQNESKDANYFKSSILQGTRYKNKRMCYFSPCACLFLQT